MTTGKWGNLSGGGGGVPGRNQSPEPPPTRTSHLAQTWPLASGLLPLPLFGLFPALSFSLPSCLPLLSSLSPFLPPAHGRVSYTFKPPEPGAGGPSSPANNWPALASQMASHGQRSPAQQRHHSELAIACFHLASAWPNRLGRERPLERPPVGAVLRRAFSSLPSELPPIPPPALLSRYIWWREEGGNDLQRRLGWGRGEGASDSLTPLVTTIMIG